MAESDPLIHTAVGNQSHDEPTRKSGTLILEMRGDGILHGIAQPDSQQTLEDARQNLVLAKELTQGKRVPLLMDIRKTGTLSREARGIYTGEEGAKVITALALIADSAFAKVVGNLVIRLASTIYPVSLFETEEEATDWLRTFV